MHVPERLTASAERAAGTRGRARPRSARSYGPPGLARRGVAVARRWLTEETSGSAAVEFAILVWPFLAMTLGALQISLIYFMTETIQTAAQLAGREYMTGQMSSDPTGSTGLSDFQSAVTSHLPCGVFNCSAVLVDVEVSSTAAGLPTGSLPAPSYTCSGTPKVCSASCSGCTFTASTPEDYVIARVMYYLPVTLSFGFANQTNGTFLMTGTTVFQVEPYPTS